MLIQEVINGIEELAPLTYAEDFDNVGLLVGDKNNEASGVLVCLDTLEEVIDEAIEKNCNLIVSFHPIIFSGLKKITGKNYVERVVHKAIKNDIAIYAIHTALDNSFVGVNAKICEVLGLKNKQVLIPQKHTIKKLHTFVPIKEANKVREALFDAGGGSIGNYDHCSFNVEGKGSFKGNENSSPVVGEKGKTHYEEETQIGITFPKHAEAKILKALFNNHPYEEVAFEITTLENSNQHIGIGMIGELETPQNPADFLKFVKEHMQTECIRHSKLIDKKIKKVAVLGGSGAFGISSAIASGADIYITGDVKYHDFYKAENKMIIADIGHYETEQFTKNLLVEYLTKKFTNFAVVLSVCNTNPVKYL
ncbi:Nif3-like dinuclear metal center hexameric protein [Galbibacter pacificus]|uniref:GTP cyclohydrolase 1 type 2 homolog n=1 Tax=Galbibacter pacificus TaxID=2996052 RepID=A0ABT6FMI5_9FLAO|nr:Nif3-like dinuclear metal center hexameric protein [Galbibacter pacificus]MDG3580811.1 Nif3-like dinuclear metal center hexameric protein [Galbibacter pacificus]MDG3584289.1 Nif3-like dinuclear metal center hexameric protein [Galbibacter pacificus]